MNEISEELDKNLKVWSENNEYLYSLLYLSWQHGLRTCACCGGHPERKTNDPYILFIVDEKNLPYFESMIGAVENMHDVYANIDYRNSSNVPDDSRVVFGVHCMMHNRMETFYELASSILERQEVKTSGGERLYKSLIELLHAKRSFIEKEIADGIVVGSTFSTFTPERDKYLSDKKKILYHLKQILTGSNSKYDNSQNEIDEDPQIKFKM